METPSLLRRRIDLVVDVGDVADVSQLVASPQQPGQHVEYDRRPGIADMRKAVDGGAADIHRDPAVVTAGTKASLRRVRVL